MIRDIKEQYRLEDENLALYATHNLASRGRKYYEEHHNLRTDFQRDRDRILHSRAFRRLEYKTQVFLNGTGDHLRTRLTHTIEVAAIARTMARSLCVNEDLTEAIALAHDLGHTPFGHAGENAIDELMKEHGGFDHNLQALRVIDILEIKYPKFNGLNLTWEVRTGLIKHRDSGKAQLDGEPLTPATSVESQIADLADDLTYYGHDIDDGLDAGLITEDMLNSLPIWHLATEKSRECGLSKDEERFKAYSVRCLIDAMVGDAVKASYKKIMKYNPKSVDDVMNNPRKIIVFSDEFKKMTDQLREFLFHNVYFHPNVQNVNRKAVDKLKFLFETYIKRPELMGKNMQSHIEQDGIYRAVSDYIAGMTDRYASLEAARLLDKTNCM